MDWIFLRFNCMSHCCFNFRSLEIYENLGLSLFTIILQSTATQKTISVNICFRHYRQYEISFFIKIYVELFYVQICF